MNDYPTKLELREQGALLRIAWSDGQTRQYTVRELREACPCATCREKRGESLGHGPAPAAPPSGFELPVLSAAEARPLTIAAMQPVGSYAYGIHFSDGHNTGIFTLELLRRSGRVV
jgi:DUF971 family protein